MPNAPKKTGVNGPGNLADLPFEEALKRLEAIVEAMEGEDLPLESLLTNYQEGTALARICQERLAEAELKVQQLERSAAGDLKVKRVNMERAENDAAESKENA